MVVCSAILSKRFKSAHYFGVFLCLTGGGMTLLNDSSHSLSKTPSSHPYSYYGDILAILAAILYGIGDAAGEFWTKHIDRKEYLGMLGLHGSVVSLMLFLIFERNTIEAIFIDTPTFMTTLSMLIWYVPSVVLFYTLATLFLVSSDATLLSLSLQSSNLWAILFSTLAFRESPPLSFCFAAIFVAAGVSIYELLGNAHQATTLDPDEV
jgi:solute carrier family 35 protein F1/2